jgi:hypothetical protein
VASQGLPGDYSATWVAAASSAVRISSHCGDDGEETIIEASLRRPSHVQLATILPSRSTNSTATLGLASAVNSSRPVSIRSSTCSSSPSNVHAWGAPHRCRSSSVTATAFQTNGVGRRSPRRASVAGFRMTFQCAHARQAPPSARGRGGCRHGRPRCWEGGKGGGAGGRLRPPLCRASPSEDRPRARGARHLERVKGGRAR